MDIGLVVGISAISMDLDRKISLFLMNFARKRKNGTTTRTIGTKIIQIVLLDVAFSKLVGGGPYIGGEVGCFLCEGGLDVDGGDPYVVVCVGL